MFHWFQSIPHPKFSISCLGLARFIIFSFPFLSFLYSHYQVPRFSHSCIRNYYTNTNTLFHHSHTQQNANNNTSSTALTPFLFVAIIHHFCSLMIVWPLPSHLLIIRSLGQTAIVPIFAVSVGLSTTHFLMIFHSHLHLILFLLRCTNPLIKIDDQY